MFYTHFKVGNKNQREHLATLLNFRDWMLSGSTQRRALSCQNEEMKINPIARIHTIITIFTKKTFKPTLFINTKINNKSNLKSQL